MEMDDAGDAGLSMLVIRAIIVVALAAMLAGCGVGCLYRETGKVLVAGAEASPSPERIVGVVGDALRPMGFSGHLPPELKPRPDWLWDYEFGVGYKFMAHDSVNVIIKYNDLSISLADYARGSQASPFDRSVTTAIQTRLKSELGADITFTHPQTPAFCLGP